MWHIPIYNRKLPKKQRVFDMEADEKGVIHRYFTQNIKGSAFVDSEDVQKQISEFLEKNAVG